MMIIKKIVKTILFLLRINPDKKIVKNNYNRIKNRYKK